MSEPPDKTLQELTVTMEAEPSREDVRLVQQGLEAYNQLHAPADNYQAVALFLRTSDKTIVGGLLGATYWQWLHVGVFWIQAHYRGKGYGERLLAIAEAEAVRRGCRAVHLDTLSFQALTFYQRLGYTIFGELPDHPPGHTRYYLKKDLPASEETAGESP